MSTDVAHRRLRPHSVTDRSLYPRRNDVDCWAESGRAQFSTVPPSEFQVCTSTGRPSEMAEQYKVDGVDLRRGALLHLTTAGTSGMSRGNWRSMASRSWSWTSNTAIRPVPRSPSGPRRSWRCSTAPHRRASPDRARRTRVRAAANELTSDANETIRIKTWQGHPALPRSGDHDNRGRQ